MILIVNILNIYYYKIFKDNFIFKRGDNSHKVQMSQRIKQLI